MESAPNPALIPKAEITRAVFVALAWALLQATASIAVTVAAALWCLPIVVSAAAQSFGVALPEMPAELWLLIGLPIVVIAGLFLLMKLLVDGGFVLGCILLAISGGATATLIAFARVPLLVRQRLFRVHGAQLATRVTEEQQRLAERGQPLTVSQLRIPVLGHALFRAVLRLGGRPSAASLQQYYARRLVLWGRGTGAAAILFVMMSLASSLWLHGNPDALTEALRFDIAGPVSTPGLQSALGAAPPGDVTGDVVVTNPADGTPPSPSADAIVRVIADAQIATWAPEQMEAHLAKLGPVQRAEAAAPSRDVRYSLALPVARVEVLYTPNKRNKLALHEVVLDFPDEPRLAADARFQSIVQLLRERFGKPSTAPDSEASLPTLQFMVKRPWQLFLSELDVSPAPDMPPEKARYSVHIWLGALSESKPALAR